MRRSPKCSASSVSSQQTKAVQPTRASRVAQGQTKRRRLAPVADRYPSLGAARRRVQVFRMNAGEPKLLRLRNIAVFLIRLAAAITLMAFSIQAHSKLVCAVLLGMGVVAMPSVPGVDAYLNRLLRRCKEKHAG